MAWKRNIRWTIFLAILAASGYAVHLLLAPAPRWELQGAYTILGITADSLRFWTISCDSKGRLRGPLHLRNSTTGAIVVEYMKTEPNLVGCQLSPSGRFVVGYENHANCLHLIDREREAETIVQLDEKVQQRLDDYVKRVGLFTTDFALFSPSEKYLRFTELVQAEGEWNCLIETATGKIKRSFDKGVAVERFLLDGSFALLKGKNRKYILWNIDKDQEETERLGAYMDGYNHHFDLSPSLRHLVTYKDERHSEAAVWDLAAWQMQELPLMRERNHYLSFSPTGRWLIDYELVADVDRWRIQVFDVPSGDRLGGYEYPIGGDFGEKRFSSDDSFCLSTSPSRAGKLTLDMVQMPKGERLWTKPLDAATRPVFDFTADGSVMIVIANNIELWDAPTGTRKMTIWQPNRPEAFEHLGRPSLSKGGKLVHAIGYTATPAGSWEEWATKHVPWLFPPGDIVVADATNGDRLLNLPFETTFEKAFDLQSILSDDSRMLILSRLDTAEDHVYNHRAYDIPARPRWAWIVGIPAGLGGLAMGWRRWRQRKKAAATACLAL